MISLEGQLAIITGGAGGIGEGICEVFCKAGATVVLWDINDGDSKTANKISSKRGKIFFQKVDITSPDSVQKAVSEIIRNHKKVDILINNAGVIRDRSFLKMKKEEWDTVIEVNLNALFVVCKAVVPYMKEMGYGRIISSSSINGLLYVRGQAEDYDARFFRWDTRRDRLGRLLRQGLGRAHGRRASRPEAHKRFYCLA